MKTSRRRFLGLAGSAIAGCVTASGNADAPRRSRWEMIAHDGPVESASFRPDPLSWADETLTAAWIGHATVLINFFGKRIITDPVFSERIGLNVGGLFTIGPKRLVLPAIPFEDLPPIDMIILSHAHMDHLDTPTLRRFDRTIPLVIAKNTFDVIEDLGFQEVYELDWGQWTQAAGIRIEALEVKHFGWRFPWERDRSRGYHDGRSYNAYLLSKDNHHVVFGGDTAYQEYFKRLAERDITIDLAIMPIGAYDPWIHNHCNPEQAVAMAEHMKARNILPMHWRTFIQSEEPTMEPIQRMRLATRDQQHLVVDSIGQTWAMGTAPAETAGREG